MNELPPVIPPPIASAEPPAAAFQKPLPNHGFVCESCGHLGWPKTFTKGNILMEFALWCLLLVPGLIYSIWRLTSRYKGCRQCHGHMIPAGSPRAQILLTQIYRR